MNTDNLHELIDRYESKIDKIYNVEHDELFKWRAIKTWRDEWFKPESSFPSFAGCFTAVRKDFSLFIDNSRMHPSSGVLKLWEKEPETVEHLFQEVLFGDCGGIVSVAQDHMDLFLDGYEALRQKYFPRNWSFKQDRHSASVYLTMNDPEFHYVYKINDHSDSDFCKEYLESRSDNAEKETMIADGAYGSEENCKLAESKNVELVTTALIGTTPDPVFADFEMDNKGERVVRCPAGYKPLGTTYYEKQGICRTRFSKEHCSNCPHRDQCRVQEQKKNYVAMVSVKKVARAQYLKKLTTEEYRQLTRQRNAIEGIPSVLRRKYRIDDIQVFGYIRSKMFFVLKIGAYNIRKLCKHRAHQRHQSTLLADMA